MKNDGLVTITSLLTVVLATLHVAGDIALGIEPGNLANLLILVPVLGLWLYATLLLPGRRGGYVILLLASLLGLFMSAVHMKGVGVGAVLKRIGGDFFFVWVLLALGVSAGFLLILAVRGLWGLRRTGPGRE
jgi:hypothetical protein